MESENLKYAKKNWSKDNLRLQETTKVPYGVDKFFYLVLMYGNDRKVAFNCYNHKLIEALSGFNKDEKLKVWFYIESKEYNGKWYTNAVLKWAETPRLITVQKTKKRQ